MPSAPYDTVETVLQTSRVRLNDAIQSINGDILTDTAAFTQTLVNGAWRRLQDMLASFGYSRLKPERIFSGVPAVASADAGSQVYINWENYYNGAALVASPVLPQDMIAPLLIWERVSGSGAVYTPMDRCLDGLPTIAKQTLNRLWEWREDAVYMPGATGLTDIRIRYMGYIADFIANSPVLATPWYGQPVRIMRSLNSLAWLICAETAKARGDLDAGGFEGQAMVAARQIFDFDPMQARSIEKDSEYGKMIDKFTPIEGPTGPKGLQTSQGQQG